MPIVVACPGCPTKLSAPDSAAGKHIRCPKCGATAPVPQFVPAEEVPVVDAAAVPKPRPKPAVVDDDDEDRPRKKAKARRDDDDDDEDDDRPRKKKRARAARDDDYDHDRPRYKKRKAGGGSGGTVALVAVGGVLLLMLIGAGIYFLTGKSSPFAKRTPVPAGWTEHKYPNDGFKAYFPKEPEVITMNGGIGMGGRFGGGRMGRGGFAGANELADVTSVSAYTSGGGDTPIVTVTIAHFRNGVPASLRDQVRSTRTGNEFGIETRKVRWLGYDAGEAIMGNMLSRVVYTDKQLIVVQITGPNGGRAKPEEETAFFDNFELTK